VTQVEQLIQAQVTRLNKPDAAVRRSAAEALYEICMEAKEKAAAAVPSLLPCLDDPDEKVRTSAEWALGYCGKSADRPLTKCLSDQRRLVRIHAAKAFGNMRRGGCRTKVALRRLLDDEDSEVRSSAAWALSLTGRNDCRSIKALRGMAESQISSDRSSALHARGNIGKTTKKKAPLQDWFRQIGPALTDDDDDVRWSAYYVLSAVKLIPEVALPLWVHGLEDPDIRVAGMAVDGLAEVAQTADVGEILQ
jgi:HEAT repeat protein